MTSRNLHETISIQPQTPQKRIKPCESTPIITIFNPDILKELSTKNLPAILLQHNTPASGSMAWTSLVNSMRLWSKASSLGEKGRMIGWCRLIGLGFGYQVGLWFMMISEVLLGSRFRSGWLEWRGWWWWWWWWWWTTLCDSSTIQKNDWSAEWIQDLSFQLLSEHEKKTKCCFEPQSGRPFGCTVIGRIQELFSVLRRSVAMMDTQSIQKRNRWFWWFLYVIPLLHETKSSSSSSLFHFYLNRQHPTSINKLHQQKLLSLWLTFWGLSATAGLIAQLFSFLFFSDAVQRNFKPFGLASAQQGWHNFTGVTRYIPLHSQVTTFIISIMTIPAQVTANSK